MKGVGCRLHGCRVCGVWCRILHLVVSAVFAPCLRFGVWGLGFGVWGLGVLGVRSRLVGIIPHTSCARSHNPHPESDHRYMTCRRSSILGIDDVNHAVQNADRSNWSQCRAKTWESVWQVKDIDRTTSHGAGIYVERLRKRLKENDFPCSRFPDF